MVSIGSNSHGITKRLFKSVLYFVSLTRDDERLKANALRIVGFFWVFFLFSF